MNKQLFFSIALLASVFSAGAMQNYNGPAKVTSRYQGNKVASITATLPNGTTVALDPRVKWTMNNGILSRAHSAPVATPAPAAVAAPKAPVAKAAPKAPALAQAATRKVGCANGMCGIRRPIMPAPAVAAPKAPVAKAAPKAPAVAAPKALKFGCANGKCGIKRPVVKQGGCANGKCNLKPKNK